MTRQRPNRRRQIRGVLATAGTLVAALAITPIATAAGASGPAPGPAPASIKHTDPAQQAQLGKADKATGGYGVYHAPKAKDLKKSGNPKAPGGADRVTFNKAITLDTALGQLDTASARQLAAQNGMSLAKAKGLATDKTLHVSADGGFFFVDPTAKPRAHGVAPHSTPFDAPFSLSDTFFLHSNPGSTKVLYLDFNGYNLPSGTAWHSGTAYNAPAYDQSGDGAGFNNTELGNIQNIWQRVAEDYGSMDIDVTTQDPGYSAINRSSGADNNYGGRVVITGASWDQANMCSSACGGVSYVGVINQTGATHDFYQPSWVFNPNVSGNKATAEAVSHEFGHAAGLSHDGTSTLGYYAGHGNWAPIMGVGYYRPVVQFSKGEYTDANNTEDDYAVMAAHGLVARGDDYGNTFGSGTWIYNGNTTNGIIERDTDGDMFQFTSCGGSVTITANPSPVSPNLDARLFLYNSSNGYIDSNDPTSGTSTSDVATGMSASLTENLTYGQTYQVWVDRASTLPATTGYSLYGSRGFYQVSIDQQNDCDLYAWVDDATTPAYQVSHSRWANPSGGGAPTVAHSSVGSYSVTWPGAVMTGGDVQVTAMLPRVTCNSAGWSSATAYVSCRNNSGSLVDSPFSVLYTHDDNSAYVWAHAPTTASYTPSAVWSHNPSGRPITISRGSVGSYTVSFPGYTGADGGNVEVTAYNSSNVRCVSNGWGDQSASVRCYDTAGNPVDSAFNLLFTKRQSSGYFWADQPSAAAPYSPAAYWAQNPSGGAVTVNRLGVGLYKATFAGVVGGLGNVQATAYGANNDCNVLAWSNNKALIDCRNTAGTAVDSYFNLLFIPKGAIVCDGKTVTVDMNVLDAATAGNDVVFGTPNNDVIDTIGGNDTVCGRSGNDGISTSGGSDRVFGGPGDDVVHGGTGNDYLDGQEGIDTVHGEDGIDQVFGNVGTDTLFGGPANDTVRGGADNDLVNGGPGTDKVYGEAGDDNVIGDTGTGDLCNGGAGTDVRGAGCETIVGIP